MIDSKKAKELYNSDEEFRKYFDECLEKFVKEVLQDIDKTDSKKITKMTGLKKFLELSNKDKK